MGSLGKGVEQVIFLFSIYLFFVQWSPVLLGDDHQLTGLIHKVCKTHIESLCEQFLLFAMALEIPQRHFMWYNRTTVCPYPWKGMSTGPGGLAALHITERWNYLQTPDSGGLFFAFSGAVYGLRKRIAKTFLLKHAERPWIPQTLASKNILSFTGLRAVSVGKAFVFAEALVLVPST